MKRFASMFLISLLFLSNTFAQDQKVLSPEEIVTIYYDQMKQGDMSTLAEYMHTQEMEKFKEMMLPAFVGLTEKAGMDPTFLQTFAHGDSIDEIKTYSSQKFFARFLEWIMALQPQLGQMLQQSDIKAIGHVVEKTATGEQIHVVVRTTMGAEGLQISKLSVMSLKKEGDDWKLMLTGEIEGMAQALKRQIQ